MLKDRKYKHKELLQVTSDIIRRFNRDTGWVATGVLCAIIFAALLLAVQERHPTTAEAALAGNNLFLNADPATMGSVIAKSSSGQMAPDPKSRVDDAFAESSAKENPLLALPAKANHQDALPDTNSWSSQMSRNSAPVIRPKVRKARDRSSSLLRTVDVKRRLIALWHQSLGESARTRSWTAFSSLSGGLRKRAAYTSETTR